MARSTKRNNIGFSISGVVFFQIAIVKKLSAFCVTSEHYVVSCRSMSIATLFVVGTLLAVDLKDPLTAF